MRIPPRLLRRLASLLCLSLLATGLTARADLAQTRGEFSNAEWVLLLSEVVTTVEPLVTVNDKSVKQYRWWTIGIASKENGYHFFVERSLKSPWDPNGSGSGNAIPELHYAESAESVFIADPKAFSVETGNQRVTVTVDAELPKTGHWAFTAVAYNYWNNCTCEQPRLHIWDNIIGEYGFDRGPGDIYPVTGTLGGEQIVDWQQNTEIGLLHNVSGWVEFLHI